MKVIDIHAHCSLDHKDMDSFVDEMDRCGVGKALVHACPEEYIKGYAGDETVALACRRHEGRLIGSMHIDLRQPLNYCLEKLENYASQGFRAVKMFPNLGFSPGDEAYEPFWQSMERLGLICFAHQGILGQLKDRRTYNSALLACPYQFEMPARRHPGVDFIFAHFGGHSFYLQTLTLLSIFPNCYADTCGGAGPWLFENRAAGLSSVSFDKVLYGTDKPKFNADSGAYIDSYEKHIAWWRAMHSSMGRSRQELESYFHGNAERLLW